GDAGGSSGTDGSSSSGSDADRTLDGSSSFGDADTGGPAPPCVTPGDRCPDGTVLAGALQGSTVKIFTTPCDYGQAFQAGACTGVRGSLPFNDGNATGGVFVGATSSDDGAGNTALLI